MLSVLVEEGPLAFLFYCKKRVNSLSNPVSYDIVEIGVSGAPSYRQLPDVQVTV
jgi:hypothetical protein